MLSTLGRYLSSHQSNIAAVKFSSLGLYLTCKLVNPYGVGVWMVDQPESLFTFNENLKFADFSSSDSRLQSQRQRLLLCCLSR